MSLSLLMRWSVTRRRAWFFVLLCSVGCIVTSTTSAQVFDEWFRSHEIILVIGEVKVITVKNPQQVKIGNPGIMDIASAGQKELLLSGLAEGETTLTVVDAYGKRQYAVQVFREDLEKVKERIDILLEAAGYGMVNTRIGYKERKIFLTGTLPNTQKDDFQNKIASLQDKTVDLITYEEALSVEIDVEVLEIGKTDLDKLGIEWDKTTTFVQNVNAESLFDPTKLLKTVEDFNTGTISSTLDFLKQNNKARTLSRPKIVCLSGKEASLLIGGERPIITGSTTTTGLGSSTQTYDIELKEYGIQLSITPIVKKNNEIDVALTTEITEVDTTNEINLSSVTSTPGFTKRSAQTQLTVIDGQTIFLAGLISSKRTDNRDSLPGLGKIPFFGVLFRHRDLQQIDTEVVITLKPTVLHAKQPTHASATATATITPSLYSTSFDSPVASLPKPVSREDELIQAYSRLVQNIIHSNVTYPQQLRDKRIKGTVKLSLNVQSSGKLLGVVIMRSSGNNVLDEIAEHTVKKLSPFPAFPKELKLKELWIDMPIVYELETRT